MRRLESKPYEITYKSATQNNRRSTHRFKLGCVNILLYICINKHLIWATRVTILRMCACECECSIFSAWQHAQNSFANDRDHKSWYSVNETGDYNNKPHIVQTIRVLRIREIFYNNNNNNNNNTNKEIRRM